MHSNTDSNDSLIRGLKDCTAGSVGGILQVLAGQPFDTVKVRLQTQPLPAPGQKPLYAGPLDCVSQTYKNEGFRGFYKGTLTPLLGVGVCVSIQFLVLEHMKRTYSARNMAASSGVGSSGLTYTQLFLSGALSGTANSIVSGPVEHVRTRLQVQTNIPAVGAGAGAAGDGIFLQKQTYTGPLDCFRQLYGTHGLKGVYKGQMATVAREFLGYGIYFALYEYLVQRAMERDGKRRNDLETWRVCGYGAAAGYALWLTTYPIDAVKSKLQTDGLTSSTRKYNSILDCVRVTYRQQGIAGFYRGFVPCILRAAPANAATFAGFEMAMRFLN